VVCTKTTGSHMALLKWLWRRKWYRAFETL